MASFDELLKMYADKKSQEEVPELLARPSDNVADAIVPSNMQDFISNKNNVPKTNVEAPTKGLLESILGSGYDSQSQDNNPSQNDLALYNQNSQMLGLGDSYQGPGQQTQTMQNAQPTAEDTDTRTSVPAARSIASAKALPQAVQTPQMATTAPAPAQGDKEFEAAQEQARQNRFLNSLLQGSMIAAKGIGQLSSGQQNVNLDESGVKSLLEQQNMPIADLTAKRQAEKTKLDLQEEYAKNDPNSPISQLMVSTIKQLSPNLKLPANFTAAQAEKAFPSIAKVLEQENARKDRALRQAELAQARSSKAQTATSEKDIKRINEVSKRLVAETSSSRSAFGRAATTLQTIQNAEALLNGERSLDDLDNRQMSELARVLDRTLSGGTPTISGTEHLTPQSSSAYVSSFLEKIKNEPVGAGQGKFAAKFQHTFDREKALAVKQIQETQGKLLAPLNDIARREEDDAAKKQLLGVLEGVGLEGSFNEKGVFVPKIETKTAQAPKGTLTQKTLEEYAKKHNTDINSAKQLLEKSGYVIK